MWLSGQIEDTTYTRNYALAGDGGLAEQQAAEGRGAGSQGRPRRAAVGGKRPGGRLLPLPEEAAAAERTMRAKAGQAGVR